MLNLRYDRGFFNRYQKSKSLAKYLFEDLKYLLWLPYYLIKGGGKLEVVVAYPHFPSKRSLIYKAAKHNGWWLTNKIPKEFNGPLVIWEYVTTRPDYPELAAYKPINHHCTDIGKFTVDAVFADVFGYSTRIDPTTYSGLAVRKNDINAKHDGAIIQCPLPSVDEGFIYQKLIDNTVEGKMVEDLRVQIMGACITGVFVKRRPEDVRFTNDTADTKIVEPSDVFSGEEIALIERFSADFKLDLGELDILRDKADGRIYIVDVNTTPQSPPQGMTDKMAARAVSSTSVSLKAYLKQLNSDR